LTGIRKLRGYKQEQLAEYLNVKRQTYSAYERDVSVPDAMTLASLSSLLDVSTDYLVGRAESFGTPYSPVVTDENKIAAEWFGDELKRIFVESGRISPDEVPTEEFWNDAVRLVRAAVAFEQAQQQISAHS